MRFQEAFKKQALQILDSAVPEEEKIERLQLAYEQWDKQFGWITTFGSPEVKSGCTRYLFNHWDDDDSRAEKRWTTGLGWTATMLEYCRSHPPRSNYAFVIHDERVKGECDTSFEGKILIVVSAEGTILHFRIFDGDGRKVVDTKDTHMTDRKMDDLRWQLEMLWPPPEPASRESDLLIDTLDFFDTLNFFVSPILRSPRFIRTNEEALDFSLVGMEVVFAVAARNNQIEKNKEGRIRPDGIGIRKDGTFCVLELKVEEDADPVEALLQALFGAMAVYKKRYRMVQIAQCERANLRLPFANAKFPQGVRRYGMVRGNEPCERSLALYVVWPTNGVDGIPNIQHRCDFRDKANIILKSCDFLREIACFEVDSMEQLESGQMPLSKHYHPISYADRM
jgi:hypothetical protein